MLLSQFKIQFKKILEEEYPPEEINSFFYLLIEAFLGLNRLDLALNPQRELTSYDYDKFETAANRLKLHEPVQYIIGETEFFSLKFRVNKNVLIPRPETEELVQWIIDNVRKCGAVGVTILDIGTGSGSIAVSLKKNLPQARVTALDISAKALALAKDNAILNEVEIEFIEADILQQELLQGPYDVVVSNPPYVRELEKTEMQKNVLEHEPALALYVKDTDPLIFYRKITKLAKGGLSLGGSLFFEINQYLASETEDLLKKEGFKTSLKKDIFGNFRMLKGNL